MPKKGNPGGVKKPEEKPEIEAPAVVIKPRRVAILGTTPSRMSGPIDDPDWEIWTIGPGGMNEHRWDRLFESHGEWPETFKDYLNQLSNIPLPQQVYTIYPMKARMERWAKKLGKDDAWLADAIKGDWSSNIVIDRDALFERHRRMWFSSSISYAVALALEEGVPEFGLWGIDLESGEEYISQHAGCVHFLELARHLGATVHMPKGCGLLRDVTPYPDRYETLLALTFEKKRSWLQHVLAENEPEYEGLIMMTHRTEGVLLRQRELMELASADPEEFQKQLSPEKALEFEKALAQYNEQQGQMASQINHLKGELNATEYYQRTFVFNMVDPDSVIS